MSHCINQTSYGTPTDISYFYGAGWQEGPGRCPGILLLTERPPAFTVPTKINLNKNHKKVWSLQEEKLLLSLEIKTRRK